MGYIELRLQGIRESYLNLRVPLPGVRGLACLLGRRARHPRGCRAHTRRPAVPALERGLTFPVLELHPNLRRVPGLTWEATIL